MDPRAERFTSLVEHVGEPVRRYVVRRTSGLGVEADDVVAEVFLVLWRRLDDVPSDDPLPWTYRVAANCLANAGRAARRRAALDDRLRVVDPPGSAMPDSADPALEHPEVHAALAELTDLDREIVRLWAWEDLGPAAIAEVVGSSPGAVSTRLTRIKQRLRADVRITGGPDSSKGEGSTDGRR